MNSLLFLLLTYSGLAGGLFAFKKSVEKLYPPNIALPTPAYSMRDGIDFEPVDINVAMGHYFMSIAGAAPIVAAIQGMMWGWLPATLYLLLAVTFLGAPSEYMQLMFSIRNKAGALGTVCRQKIGMSSGTYINIIMLFVCALTFAVMGNLFTTSLANTPTAAVPTLSLIPIAVLFGFLRNRVKLSSLLATVISLLLWAGTIILGLDVPIVLSATGWAWVITIYVVVACFVPVHWLLAPRDYLNSFILVIGLLVGTVAVFVGRPDFSMPAFTSWETARGYLYPGIIATIGCGAINGMHAIISMGTTPKMVKNEKDSYWITAIGTRGETIIGFLSIALIASAYGLEDFLGKAVAAPGPAFTQALGNAYTNLGFSESVGMVFGTLIITGFIITTIDSYARTGRIILKELTQDTKAKIFANPVVGSFVVTAIGLFLLLSTPFGELWSGFALIAIQLTIYCYSLALLKRIEDKEKFNGHFTAWVIVPGAFMTLTTCIALVMYFVRYMWELRLWASCVSSHLCSALKNSAES